MSESTVVEDETVYFEAPVIIDRGVIHVELTVNSQHFAGFDFANPHTVTACRVALKGIDPDGVATKYVDGTEPATVEDLARWIQGDGTDAQRMALADGIRRGDWRRFDYRQYGTHDPACSDFKCGGCP